MIRGALLLRKMVRWARLPLLVRLVLSAGLFLALPTMAAATPVEKTSQKEFGQSKGQLTVGISSSEISVAESLDLTLEIIEPAGTVADLPSFDELGFATDFTERSQRFRVTNISEITRESQPDGSTLIRQEYTLEPWLSGDYAILPIMVSFYGPEEEKGGIQGSQAAAAMMRVPLFSLMTDGVRVKVAPLPNDRRELSDLLGQADLKPEGLLQRERRAENKSDEELRREEEAKSESAKALKERSFPWWIVWVLLGVVVLVPIVWLVWGKKISRFIAGKTRPAHEVAYLALEELQRQQLLESGRIKEYYYQLSFILREYIGGRFGIYAVRQTTEEFFSKLLLKNPFDAKTEQILRDFSDQTDTVKYSLFRPGSPEAEKSLGIVRHFIDTTKQEEEGRAQ